MAEAVAKVDILTQQLDRTRAHKMFYHVAPQQNLESSISEPAATCSPAYTTEIERLKQEQRLRCYAVQQQKRKIDDKDTSLLHKTLQRNELDQKINDIAERLQKRRLQPVNTETLMSVPPGRPNANTGNSRHKSVPVGESHRRQEYDGDRENRYGQYLMLICFIFTENNENWIFILRKYVFDEN